MAGIRIITDSACDLTEETAEARDVRIVPLTIRFGAEELVDRKQLSTKEFWDRVITGDVIPETAAPSPGSFHEAFEDAERDGCSGVLCVTLSSKLSATYESACAATRERDWPMAINVVDSLSLTMGQGLMVLEACDMASSGASLEEITARLHELTSRTRVYGIIRSLDFLRRGGRIGGASHLVGSVLSIKPVIEVRDGVVEVESKQRTRQRSLQYLASRALEAGPLERIAVANGAADDIDQVLGALKDVRCAHELVVTDLGPVIGSHAGPGAIGVCFQIAS